MPPARRTSYRGLDLEAARTRTVPDVLPAPGQPFRVLFCGINPGLYSAATGHHFARPGNRFWPALHAAGFTPRLLAPGEQQLLAEYGLGITNLVARATAQASELTRDELQAGGAQLADLVARHQPRIVAVAGVTAYRAAFGKKAARVGPQAETIGATTNAARAVTTPAITNASLLIRSASIPRSAATSRSSATPRIAVPSQVRL